MTSIRNTSTSPNSPSGTCRQNRASTSETPRQQSSPDKPTPPSPVDTFSQGDQASQSRLFGRLLSSDEPIRAVSTRATTTSVGERLEQPNTELGDKSNHPTAQQRKKILDVFIDYPTKQNIKIAQQFGVSQATICKLRQQFKEIGNIDFRDKKNRLTHGKRQEILDVFINDPTRTYADIAQQFQVDQSTIYRLRQQFNETGNIAPRDRANRLTDEQRQAILRIFTDNPTRNNTQIALQFGVSQTTISKLRQQFQETEDIV